MVAYVGLFTVRLLKQVKAVNTHMRFNLRGMFAYPPSPTVVGMHGPRGDIRLPVACCQSLMYMAGADGGYKDSCDIIAINMSS